jgi:cell division protein FtsL
VTAGGLAWVLVLAALLGGIVALNVAALRTNIRVSGLSDRAAALQQANRTLNARVATLTVPYRIDAQAQRLGMVRPSPAARDYIPFKPRRVDHRARAFAR